MNQLFAEHDVSLPCDANSALQRYFKFRHFLDFIQGKHLLFVRVIDYATEDPKEGTWTIPDQRLGAELLKRDHRNNPNSTPDQLMSNARLYSDPDIFAMRHKTVINCWQKGHSESSSMWKTYGQDTEDAPGILVRTRAKDLASALAAHKNMIHGTDVIYLDHACESVDNRGSHLLGLGNVMTPIVHKNRPKYAEESEFRLFKT